MELEIAGRAALVLGSTRGLGLAVAHSLAAEGVRVAICGRSEGDSRARAAELAGAIGLEFDLRDPQSVSTLSSAVKDAFGGVDILVLNGGGPTPGTAEQWTSQAVSDGLQLILSPMVQLVGELLPEMRRRQWGRILAVGSSGVQQPIPGLVASNTLRSGLGAYLKTLAAEVAADGVTVNMLIPGRFATDRVAELDAVKASRTGRSIDEIQAESIAQIPVGRYGDPMEMGAVAGFLCSQLASYITGSQVRVDGGMIRSL